MSSFLLLCNQETFWRIPAEISDSQLKSAAAALRPRDEVPKGAEEQDSSRSPIGESQGEDEEENNENENEKENENERKKEERKKEERKKEKEEGEVSVEHRVQALRAVRLKRQRKRHTSEHTGTRGSFRVCNLSQMTAVQCWITGLQG